MSVPTWKESISDIFMVLLYFGGSHPKMALGVTKHKYTYALQLLPQNASEVKS